MAAKISKRIPVFFITMIVSHFFSFSRFNTFQEFAAADKKISFLSIHSVLATPSSLSPPSLPLAFLGYVFGHIQTVKESNSSQASGKLISDQIDPFYEKLFEDGKYFFSIGDYTEAIENFKIAFFGFIDNPPRLLESFVYLTVCYYLTKDLEKARHFNNEIKRMKLQEYFKVVKLPENLLDKFHDINSYFARMEAKITAAAPATSEIKLPASNIASKGETVLPYSTPPVTPYFPRAELETEIKELRESIKKNRTGFEAYFRLSSIYLEQKRLKAAKSVLKDFLKVAPENASAHLELGKILASEKKYRDALVYLKKASPSLQGDIELHYELGKVHFELKNYKTAKEEFLKVQEINATYRDTEKYLASIGEIEKARHIPLT